MDKRIEISFVDKIVKPQPKSKTLESVLNVLGIVLFPLVIAAGLIVMFFALLLSIWQKLTISKSEKLKDKIEEENIINIRNQWAVFYQTPNLLIQQKPAGFLPQDSGDYLYLKSTPQILYLEGKFFGEWSLVDLGGIFLQKWNDVRNINCDLIFIPFDTLEVTILKMDIPTKYWTTEKVNENEIKFTFSFNNDDLIYVVQQSLLQN